MAVLPWGAQFNEDGLAEPLSLLMPGRVVTLILFRRYIARGYRDIDLP